ncbi:MAG: hypothetical protein MUC49_02070 [Raineya sp.]|jgi:hypothetical protein|nr:hypothetical protein [Raineya sp.]
MAKKNNTNTEEQAFYISNEDLDIIKQETPKNQRQRAFLNKLKFCHGAYIKTELDLSLSGKEYSKGYRIVVKDCENQSVIHGSIHDKESLENAKYKIGTMAFALSNMLKFIDKNEADILKSFEKKEYKKKISKPKSGIQPLKKRN